MGNLVIFVLEDEDAMKGSWLSAVEEHNKTYPNDTITLKLFATPEEAERELFNGKENISIMVLDRKIERKDNEGANKGEREKEAGDYFIEFAQKYLQIPVVTFSGLIIGAEQYELPNLQIKKSTGADKLVELIYEYHKMGALNILSHSGEISELTKKFFQTHFPFGRQYWNVTKDKQSTETPILRHLSSYIHETLAANDEHKNLSNFHVPEVYAPSTDLTNYAIGTGDIIAIPGNKKYDCFIVLTPQCDLVLQPKNVRKAENVLLIKFSEFAEPPKAERYFTFSALKIISSTFKQNPDDKVKNQQGEVESQQDEAENLKKRAEKLEEEKAFYNSDLKFVADFQQLKTLPYDDVVSYKKNTPFKLKISNTFLKELINQFGRYYGRQGVPNIEKSPLHIK